MLSPKWVLFGLLFPALCSSTAVACTATLNGGTRQCCEKDGLCQSSSCTVFGFKNSAKANCHPGTCANSKCVYVGSCKPGVTPPNQNVHCYGKVMCITGDSCEGNGQLCLDDGFTDHFKVCGDDACPTSPDGTCPGSCTVNQWSACTGACGQTGFKFSNCGTKDTCTMDPCCQDTEWSACNAPCGGTGWQLSNCGRKRTCDGPDCCVDTEWSACNATCGGTGWELSNCGRHRSCDGSPCCEPRWWSECDAPCGEHGSKHSNCNTTEPCKEDCCVPDENSIVCNETCGRTGVALTSCGTTVTCVAPPEVACECGNCHPCFAGGSTGLYERHDLGKVTDKVNPKKEIKRIGTVTVVEAAPNAAGFTVTVTVSIDPDYVDTRDLKQVRLSLSTQPLKDSGSFDWRVKFDKPAVGTHNLVATFENKQVDFTCPKDGSGGYVYLRVWAQVWGGNKNGRGVSHAFSDDDGNFESQKRGYARWPIECSLDCPVPCVSLTCTEPHMHCVGDNSGEHCVCDQGYNWTGTACANIDECTLGSDWNDCAAGNAVCTDTDGSYVCTCNDGFVPVYDDNGVWQECLKPCLVVGQAQLLQKRSGLATTKVGTVAVAMKVVNSVPQFQATFTMDGGRILKSYQLSLSATRAKDHAYGLYPYKANKIGASSAATAWLTISGYTPDCSSESSSLWLSARVGFQESTGAGGSAWANGLRTDDINAMDFEMFIRCVTDKETDTCPLPAASACPNCGENAVCDYLATAPYSQCVCQPGYGPGTAGPCSDFDECTKGNSCGDSGSGMVCTNVKGTYMCVCPTKTTYDGEVCVATSPGGKLASEEEVATDPASAAAGTSTATWVWAVIGVLSAAVGVLGAVVAVQFAMRHRAEMDPFYSEMYDHNFATVEGPIHPTPSRSALSSYMSPHEPLTPNPQATNLTPSRERPSPRPVTCALPSDAMQA